MARRNVLSKAVAAGVIAGAMTFTSVFSGLVSADSDIKIGVGELQECTISKSMDAGDGDVDGRDFLIWQKTTAASDDRIEEVAFYYNKIAFNNATTLDGHH
jgi:hypothetical protein